MASLEEILFLFWKLPVVSSVTHIVNRLITAALQNIVLISSENDMKCLELEHKNICSVNTDKSVSF
jgi:hypothetical protein